MERFRWKGLNIISESLGATGVLSEEYRRFIISWALDAAGEAYNEGKKEGAALAQGEREEPSMRPETEEQDSER